jgi:Fic family protein
MERSVSVDWHGRSVQAARPDKIADLDPRLSERTVRRTEQAVAAVQRAGDRSAGVFEGVARLLLRAEGLASSAIEGIRAPAGRVAVAQATYPDDDVDVDRTAAWVADNLAVVIEALATPGPLDRDRLFAWHERLMANSPTIADRHIGAYRDVLGWVGGANPLVATHVAVPPEHISALMDDLFAFVAREDLDAVTQAGIAHAQFETIHPFADGNGRLGRVLIGRILSHRLGVAVPPPVSLILARDVGGYGAGLTLYRQGQVELWVDWFADCVAAAAGASTTILNIVAELQIQWRDATIDLRSDSAARRLVEVLPAHPVVSARSVSDLLGVSEQAGRAALDSLALRGVLVELRDVPFRRGRPRRWWEARGLLKLLGR